MGTTASRPSTHRPPGRELFRKPVWLLKEKGDNFSVTEVMCVVCCATLDGQHSSLVMFEKGTRCSTDVRLADLENITQSDCLSQAYPQPRTAAQSGYAHLSSSSDMPSCLWPISLVTKDPEGSKVVFAVESQEDRLQWCARLKVLKLYPYSPIPCEPTFNPAEHLPRGKLNPAEFNADSVWYVCVLSEEVGSRIPVTGVHILALRSQVSRDHVGELKLFSAGRERPLVILWDRSTIEEGGRLGDLVFVRILKGAGAPGLLWLYAGADEAASSFHKAICRFIEEENIYNCGNVPPITV